MTLEYYVGRSELGATFLFWGAEKRQLNNDSCQWGL